MVAIRPISRPPIKEALVDLRLKYKEPLSAEQLDAIHSALSEELPKKTLRAALVFTFSSGQPSQENGVDGYVLKDKLGKKVLQVNKEGITFSLIDCYSGWDSFIADFWHFLEVIVGIAPVLAIERVGVRFIDKILLPVPVNSLTEYFTVVPDFSAVNEGAPSEWFMRTTLPRDNLKCILTQAINPAESSKDKIAFILDIDVFELKNFEFNETALESTLSTMREVKNDVFFASITDHTVEMLNASE
jgi:uncharacterized protein (TIGR04255 family)